MDNKVYTTNSPEETRNIGKEIGKALLKKKRFTRSEAEGGEVLCLYGELGAGKTTFTQGLAEGLGIEKRIVSPTFILIRQYAIRNTLMLYHLDCYRLENEKDAQALGLEEIVKDKNNILIIEWAERIGKMLPEKRTEIKFEMLNENTRRILVTTLF